MLLQVYDRDTREALGTAFAIAPHVVLTCFHVVALHAHLRLRSGDLDVAADLDASRTDQSLDLAVLTTAEAIPWLVAVEYAWQIGERVEVSGYQLSRVTPSAPFPGTGHLVGVTTAPYFAQGHAFPGTNVIRLDASVVEPGLSGAPALLVDAGVAIGVVVSRAEGLGGFIMPFGNVVATASPIAATLEQNRQAIPRYGRFLNGTGLQTAATVSASEALQIQASRKQYVPGHNVARDPLDVRQFLASTHHTRVVQGPSGVGKTYLLSSQVEERLQANQPALLLRAEVDDFSSLEDFVANEIEKGSGKPPAGTAAGIDRVLKSSAQRLLIAIDGLNEAPVDVKAVRRWLNKAQQWSLPRSVDLLIGCRPEYWALVESALIQPAKTVQLGWFSDDELQQAYDRYNIAAPVDAFAYPLLLRLATEPPPSGSAPPAVASIATALDAYAAHATTRVVIALDGRATREQVRFRLRAIGERLVQQPDNLWLTRHDFDAACADPELAAELVKEGLFTEARDQVRPAFDQWGYWLQAEATHNATLTSIMALQQSPFIMPYVVPRLSPTEVNALIGEFLDRIFSEKDWWQGVYQLAFALSQSDRVEADDEHLARLTRAVIQEGFGVQGPLVTLEPLLKSTVVPYAFLLRLAWHLAPLDDEYPFRHKDWTEPDRADDIGRSQMASQVLGIINGHDEALETVMSWCTDVRPLSEDHELGKSSAATVGSWAGAITVTALKAHTPSDSVARVFVALRGWQDTRGRARTQVYALMSAMVFRHPEEVLRLWEDQLSRGLADYHGFVSYCADVRDPNETLTAFAPDRWSRIKTAHGV